MDTTSGTLGDQRGWITEHHATPGLQVVLLKKTYVFPWSQFLYAEGTAEEVRVAFTTHDIVIKGALLGSLLDELTAQRVARLSEPARTDKFIGRSAGKITALLVRKPDGNSEPDDQNAHTSR
jgi:hypothetical protein